MALADPILQQVRCVPFVSGSGIEVLGCPVDFLGSSVQFDATWNATLDKLSLGISHLDDLQDPQVSHALLRSCLDAGKVMHLLRSSDVTRPSLRTHIARADSMILSAFEECVGGGISHTSLMQASLPFRAGGCGIRVPSHFQVPARISFLAGLPTRAKPLKPPASWLSLDSRGQEMHTLLTSASTTLGENAPPVADWKRRPGTIPASNPQFFRQSWWSDRYTESAVRLLSATANGNDRDTVRLACQLKGQGSGWMKRPHLSFRPPSSPHRTTNLAYDGGSGCPCSMICQPLSHVRVVVRRPVTPLGIIWSAANTTISRRAMGRFKIVCWSVSAPPTNR